MEIEGNVAVVTGAAAGIGQAIACRLAELGARIVLADIAGCSRTLGMVGAAGGEAIVVNGDLRDDGEIGRLVDTAVQRFGGLQILVNNAGGGQPTARYPDAQVSQWAAVLELNLRTPMLATQVALPALRANGGAVVNVASTAGLDHQPYEWPEYGAAKPGLIPLSVLTDAVIDLIRNEKLAGHVVVLRPDQPPYPLTP